MNNANDYFDGWLKAQTQAFEAMHEQAENMRAFFQGSAQSERNPFEAWREAAMKAVSVGADGESIRDALAKTFGSSNAAQKLYEIWQPLLKAIQAKTLDPATYKTQVDPESVKAMIDKLFDFDADALSQLQKQLAQFAGNAEHFGKPWSDAALKNLQLYPQFADGHPETLMKMFHNMYGAFDSTFGRSFHVPAVGKDREKVELMARCVDDMSIYAAKNAEFQHTLYLTGLEAMEKVIAALALKIEEGKEIVRFDDFFDLWIDTNEKTFYALFQTQEYSKLKGGLLEAGLNARKHYFKLMEMVLFDLPIALRSEMDDLYKTIHELRKTVKRLEKQVKERNQ